MSRRDFYLVQRLTRRDSTVRGGFDGTWSCQYMGAAEFEYGALPKSLARIRATEVVLHLGEVTRRDSTRTVYVVGPAPIVGSIPQGLTEWLTDSRPYGHERTYFEDYVEGTNREYASADAWWALNEDVMWTLDPVHADDLLQAVRPA